MMVALPEIPVKRRSPGIMRPAGGYSDATVSGFPQNFRQIPCAMKYAYNQRRIAVRRVNDNVGETADRKKADRRRCQMRFRGTDCCSASNIDPIRSNEIKELLRLSASNAHADQHCW